MIYALHLLILLWSLVADFIFNSVNASVQGDCILLNDHLLLDKRVNLRFEEVAFVDLVDLKLLEVFIKVLYIFNDLL